MSLKQWRSTRHMADEDEVHGILPIFIAESLKLTVSIDKLGLEDPCTSAHQLIECLRFRLPLCAEGMIPDGTRIAWSKLQKERSSSFVENIGTGYTLQKDEKQKQVAQPQDNFHLD
ncbi:uncharacterized protein TRIREDRAFT_112238 [Trichoderma reesei QM6a]|uniref:Predicted protein n=2 Tax=Hypocrea jecorina TaxID=51453 RepID=G0RWJ9_HYPJQ|nr:uncharacterized protein TRIREDRAFT_112238 [Trichoderma reesei QM6a]EGR44449.1 predicted protein [Trichoderma reesei QM6a]ETR97124.1 hypothetical protein M419DRAFT_92373 [Trichoderma reesei RUT C-30]